MNRDSRVEHLIALMDAGTISLQKATRILMSSGGRNVPQVPVSVIVNQVQSLNSWIPQAPSRIPKWVRLKSHDELMATGWVSRSVGGVPISYEHTAVPVTLTGDMLVKGAGLHNWNDFIRSGSVWNCHTTLILSSYAWHEEMFTSPHTTPQYDAYNTPSIPRAACADCAHVYVNVSFMHCKMACKHCGIDQPASLAPTPGSLGDIWP